MDNLDLELIKKMAEIEGITHWVNWDGPNDGFIDLCNPMGDEGPKPWNPLTDKAMLLDLIFKHRVSIVMNGNGDNHAFFMDKDIDIYQPEFEKFPRSILEAIVEANNEI